MLVSTTRCMRCRRPKQSRRSPWCSEVCGDPNRLSAVEAAQRDLRTCRFCPAPMAGKVRKAVICGSAECTKAYRAESYRKNRTEELAGMRRWHGQNRAAKVAYSEAWRAANPDYFRDYLAARPDKARLEVNRRRARLALNGVYVVSDRDLDRLFRRHRYRCAYCDRSGPLQMDHVVPIARGGPHGIGNLLPACGTCNKSKGPRLLTEWKQRPKRLAVLL